MAQYTSATFTGTSGNDYQTIVFPFNTKFKAGIGGVYMVTKRSETDDGKITHEPFFLGSAQDLVESFKYHSMQYQFKKYEVNSICVIRETDEGRRKEIFSDLIEKYRPLLNEYF